jgi:hypothetical protein
MLYVRRAFEREALIEKRTEANPERSNTAMKSTFNRILAIAALGLIAVCASASTASAQDVYKGKFTLPADARWDNATLPAGEYTFSLKSVALPTRIVVTGPNGSQFVITSSTNDKFIDAPSSLELERRNGAYFISEMYLADLHMQLNYRHKGQPKGTELAMGPLTIETVLIASAK